MAIVLLDGLGQLKNPMTSSGFEPMTFCLAAQCLNKLCYHESWYMEDTRGIPCEHSILTIAFLFFFTEVTQVLVAD
jgi:hypothetical protein